MYGEHYQVGEMSTTSSAYNYYPNYHHNHSHLHHHHHHMHHNPTAEILSGFSAQNHASNQTPTALNTSSNHSLSSMYHEYGITMSNNEHNFYDGDSNMQSYYPNQSNASEHHGLSTASHQTTPTSVSSSSNDVLTETVASHIISSDNGLSYTNLDYMYSSGHSNPLYIHQPDDKSTIAHPYNTPPNASLESNLHSQQHSTVWQSQQSTSNHPHHGTAYLENSVNTHQIGVGQVSCLQNQSPLATTPNGIHPRSLNNRNEPPQSQQNTQNQTQHGQTVQTYKWMQVKRNVPKPPGI